MVHFLLSCSIPCSYVILSTPVSENYGAWQQRKRKRSPWKLHAALPAVAAGLGIRPAAGATMLLPISNSVSYRILPFPVRNVWLCTFGSGFFSRFSPNGRKNTWFSAILLQTAEKIHIFRPFHDFLPVWPKICLFLGQIAFHCQKMIDFLAGRRGMTTDIILYTPHAVLSSEVIYYLDMLEMRKQRVYSEIIC